MLIAADSCLGDLVERGLRRGLSGRFAATLAARMPEPGRAFAQAAI
jgi:hypothetical protein